ncbi:MAG: rRNA maturation RNase YbeY, partial [Patescibacteria group bacterium]
MIKVYVRKQTNYPIKASVIKRNLISFFKERGIVSDAVVSVVIVGEKKMLDIGRKYLKDNNVHNVLSFTADEGRGDFVYPPGEHINLGEIVVCYPKAAEEAKGEGKRIDEKVSELLEHGALHLMGIHHD